MVTELSVLQRIEEIEELKREILDHGKDRGKIND